MSARFAAGARRPERTLDDRNSSATWWKNNMRGYWYCVKRDATDIYRGIDRHFFNYDWEDPYMD